MSATLTPWAERLVSAGEATPERLRKARLGVEMQQQEAAFEIGISQQHLSRWERGIYEPSAKALRSMSIVYRVSTDFLLGLTGSEVW